MSPSVSFGSTLVPVLPISPALFGHSLFFLFFSKHIHIYLNYILDYYILYADIIYIVFVLDRDSICYMLTVNAFATSGEHLRICESVFPCICFRLLIAMLSFIV